MQCASSVDVRFIIIKVTAIIMQRGGRNFLHGGREGLILKDSYVLFIQIQITIRQKFRVECGFSHETLVDCKRS